MAADLCLCRFCAADFGEIFDPIDHSTISSAIVRKYVVWCGSVASPLSDIEKRPRHCARKRHRPRTEWIFLPDSASFRSAKLLLPRHELSCADIPPAAPKPTTMTSTSLSQIRSPTRCIHKHHSFESNRPRVFNPGTIIAVQFVQKVPIVQNVLNGLNSLNDLNPTSYSLSSSQSSMYGTLCAQ